MTPDAPGTSATPLPPEDRLARMEQIVLALAQQQAAPAPRHSDHVEPIVKLLIATTLVLVIIAVLVTKWSPDDGQVFQLLAGLASGFAGAVLAKIKPAEQPKKTTEGDGK